jgi:hypothetical protein
VKINVLLVRVADSVLMMVIKLIWADLSVMSVFFFFFFF